MTRSFKGKNTVIIGGTSGMGNATAKLLLESGANVRVVSKDSLRIESAVKELREWRAVKGTHLDITNDTKIQSFTKEIKESTQKIDFLVNASGFFLPKSFLDHTIEDYDSYMKLNRGFFFITQAIARIMK